jgi:hypothetical protein
MMEVMTVQMLALIAYNRELSVHCGQPVFVLKYFSPLLHCFI